MGNELLQSIAGVSGNALEWFDFTLFGYFSDIIAQVFFPPSSTHGNLAKSFALFGGAFLCRPFGGMLTGHFGDKYGRKQALVISLVMMAIPTFAMGCLPTYEQVGGWSTAMLIICRLVQGFSVGGQLTASLTYTVEKKPKENWGYYGSMVGMAANFGCLMGNLIAALLRTILTEESLVKWGWRIPFLCGILILVVAVYIKCFGEEHNPNADEYAEGESSGGNEFMKHPFKEALAKENFPALISSALTPMLHMAGFYITFVWAAVFMDDLIEPPVNHAFWINAMSLLFGNTVFYPVGGWLSDHYGRIRLMVIGSVGVGIIGPFMLYVMSLGRSIPAFFAQWSLGVILAMYSGPIHAWLVEKFPSKIRLTSVALGYNIASCTAGAFSPLIATVMVHHFGPVAPGFLYPVFGFLGLIGMFMSKKVHQDGGAVDEKVNAEEEGDQTLDNDDLGAPLL